MKKTIGWLLFICLQITAVAWTGWNLHQQLEREDFIEDFITVSNNQFGTVMQTEMITWHLAAKHEGLFPECERCKEEYMRFQADIKDYVENND